MTIDDPKVLEEVNAAFAAYERALEQNDLAELERLFWNSDKALRYGIFESSYGIAEITGFRNARRPLGKRETIRTSITTFGQDYASTNIEFTRDGQTRLGRQSQCWVRVKGEWRIVAAHVSFQS